MFFFYFYSDKFYIIKLKLIQLLKLNCFRYLVINVLLLLLTITSVTSSTGFFLSTVFPTSFTNSIMLYMLLVFFVDTSSCLVPQQLAAPSISHLLLHWCSSPHFSLDCTGSGAV